VQKPQVKVKKSRTKRAGLGGEPEATGQPRPPPALKRARKAEKKTKPSKMKWESPEPQPMLETDRLRTKDSPEAFGVYASSEASEQEEPSRKSPVEAGPGKQRLNERKKRRLKEISSDSPRVGFANKGKTAPSVEHSESEHMELDGQTKAEELEKEDTNDTAKSDQSPEPAPEASQDGQSTATRNGESGHQEFEPQEPFEEEDDTVAADFEHVQIAETLQECPVGNVQAFAVSTAEDQVAEVISEKNVEMEDAKVVSSDQDTSSPNSVFDPADSPAPANNLPAPKSRLKRKRGASQSAKVSVVKTARPDKKGRGDVSPPSSIEHMGEVETTTKPSNKKRKIADASNKKAKASGSRKLSASQPTLGSWVKSLSSDASLKHLPFQPTPAKKRLSRTIADFVSKSATLAGPSNSRISADIPKRPKGWSKKVIEQINADKTLASKIGPITVQTSANGKKRAEPDIDYASPLPKGSQNVPGSPDLGGNANEGGLATTVARRDFPGRGNRTKDKVPVSEDSDKSASSSENAGPDTDSESSRLGLDYKEAATSIQDSKISKRHLCKTCHRTFKTARILRLHWSHEGIHDNLLKCSDCSDTFFSATALAKHRRKKSHGGGTGGGTGSEGRKGPFGADEVWKIEEWRDSFCAEFKIDRTVFNDMMAASCRKGRDTSWNWNFILKQDFLEQYNSLLPNRNRRSMLRYRERNFQNVETSKVWTKDDDDELENLVKELGTKWIEIGQRLTRTSDAVSQRWRNRVQHRHKMNGGDWRAQETELLKTAIVKLKTRLGVPLDESSDYRIAWSQISNEMGNIRTAQQCSNHWKWLAQEHRFSERAQKVPKGFDDGGELKAKGKGKRRSEGARRGRPPSKAAISDEYIKESDEEGEGEREAANGDEQEESESDVQESRSKSAERTKQQRRDLPKVAESSLQGSVMLTKKGVHSLPDSQNTGSGTPRPPYNLLTTRTPAQDMTLSQAFGHTQANTSALRGSGAGGKEVVEVTDSQDRPERPSPAIKVRLRAGAVEEEEEEDEEVKDKDRVVADSDNEGEEEAPQTLNNEEIASAKVDSTRSESEPRTKIKKSQEFGGDDVESEEESLEGEDEGSDDAVEEDQKRDDGSEDETSSSGSTSESGSEDENEDSMVEGTKDDFHAMNQNDFMANLKATADRSKGRVMGVARRPLDAKMDDSESDSDSK